MGEKQVDHILEQLFDLSMRDFYSFMEKLQEKMLEYQGNIENVKFK